MTTTSNDVFAVELRGQVFLRSLVLYKAVQEHVTDNLASLIRGLSESGVERYSVRYCKRRRLMVRLRCRHSPSQGVARSVRGRGAADQSASSTCGSG